MTLVDNALPTQLVEIKSKFNAEFRRVAVYANFLPTFEAFSEFFLNLHHLANGQNGVADGQQQPMEAPVEFFYKDPNDNKELLPINNDTNYLRALRTAKPLLRLFLLPRGAPAHSVLNLKSSHSNVYSPKEVRPVISKPAEFRQIAAIIDVDVIPETLRRVKLLKHTQDKPLGFFIRDGISMRQTNSGLKKVPGIFISRLVPGGLAEMTGLLSVNDEVLEVNGIDVYGKTLDQVTDMMVANSSNLIITVKPINQRNNVASQGPMRGSAASVNQSRFSLSQGDDEEDDVMDLLKSTSQIHLSSTHTLTGASGTLDSRASDSSSSKSRYPQANQKNGKSNDHLFLQGSSSTLDRKKPTTSINGRGDMVINNSQYQYPSQQSKRPSPHSTFASQPNLYDM